MMELIDEPDRAIAQPAALGVAQLVHGGARDVDRAPGRQIEAAQQLQQRRLTRAGRPDDGDALARAHRIEAPRSTWSFTPPWMNSLARSVPSRTTMLEFGIKVRSVDNPQSFRRDSAGSNRAARQAG